MVSQKVSSCVILLVGCLLAGTSHGRTWFVERDGSGDFTIIQDAVDAASSGDEIRIGPGHYTEYMLLSGGRRAYINNNGTKSLAFIGSSTEETVIGPTTYTENYNEWGIGCLTGNVTITIENLCFRNINYQAVGSQGHEFIARNCLFDHCYMGALISNGASIATFEDCRFENGAGVFSDGLNLSVPHARVERCSFVSCAGGVNLFYGGATDVIIRDCSFIGGELGQIGVNVVMGSGALVENCTFQGHSLYGLAYGDAGTLVFRDNIVESSGGWACVTVGPAQHVVMEGNVFVGGHRCFFLREGRGGPQEFHGNHILRDESLGGYFVEANQDWIWDETHYDFSGNYWGNTDTDYISEWILDGNDLEGVPLYADFLPIADGPVQTESTTWGAVKSLFR